MSSGTRLSRLFLPWLLFLRLDCSPSNSSVIRFMCVASHARRLGVSFFSLISLLFHIVRACCALIFIRSFSLHYQKQLQRTPWYGQSGNYCRRGLRATTVGCGGGDDDGTEGSLKTAIGNRRRTTRRRRGGTRAPKRWTPSGRCWDDALEFAVADRAWSARPP